MPPALPVAVTAFGAKIGMALTLTRAGINEMILDLRCSVDIPLANFRRVIVEPIPDLSPVAREHLRNITDRHSVLLAQANRVLPHLPGGSKVAGIFVIHHSCSEMRAERPVKPLGPSHTRPAKRFDIVEGNKDFFLACRIPFLL